MLQIKIFSFKLLKRRTQEHTKMTTCSEKFRLEYKNNYVLGKKKQIKKVNREMLELGTRIGC